LSKVTGINHTTLWRIKKGNALGIKFAELEKICGALKCTPGDLLRITGKKLYQALPISLSCKFKFPMIDSFRFVSGDNHNLYEEHPVFNLVHQL